MTHGLPFQLPRDFSPADGSARYVLDDEDTLAEAASLYLQHRGDLPSAYLGLLERRPETDEETLLHLSRLAMMTVCVFRAAGWGNLNAPSAAHIHPENEEWVELMGWLCTAALRAEERITLQQGEN